MPQCKAKAKSTGKQCGNGAMAGFAVCRMHGANKKNPGGAPKKNRHAQKHGTYGTLIRDALSEEDRVVYDAIDAQASLANELRVLRFKLWKLVGDVEQNVHGKDKSWVIKADDFEKGRAIAYLAGEIRKITKEMQSGSEDDPLLALVEDWKAGMEADNATKPIPKAT